MVMFDGARNDLSAWVVLLISPYKVRNNFPIKYFIEEILYLITKFAYKLERRLIIFKGN